VRPVPHFLQDEGGWLALAPLMEAEFRFWVRNSYTVKMQLSAATVKGTRFLYGICGCTCECACVYVCGLWVWAGVFVLCVCVGVGVLGGRLFICLPCMLKISVLPSIIHITQEPWSSFVT